MKIIVKKDIVNGGFKFVYPDGYDAQKIVVSGYEHVTNPAKQGKTEFMVGVAADSFVENEDMVVISESEHDILEATYKLTQK